MKPIRYTICIEVDLDYDDASSNGERLRERFHSIANSFKAESPYAQPTDSWAAESDDVEINRM
jgi:hypothetical protein